jgi:hypothetical protein
MRSWQWWSLRIAIMATLIMTAAFLDRNASDRSFVQGLIFGTAVLGPIFLLRLMDDAAKRRRGRAQQQASNLGKSLGSAGGQEIDGSRPGPT